MNQNRSESASRRMWVGLIAFFVLLYGISANWIHKSASQVSDPPSAGAIPMTAGQVPDGVQNKVIAALGNVMSSDEIAFFPLQGNRVGVYITVDLGYGHTELTSADGKVIRKDVDDWFNDVYSPALGHAIADAEIFFSLDGRTVAGAGMGEDAYQNLNAGVLANGATGDLSQVIQREPQISGESVNEEWMQIQP